MRAQMLKPSPGSEVPGPPPSLQPRRGDDIVPERFYRDLISGIRNGVIVIRHDGTLVAINDAAYASLDMLPGAADVGRPIAAVLADVPEMVRVLEGAFASVAAKTARFGRHDGAFREGGLGSLHWCRASAVQRATILSML